MINDLVTVVIPTYNRAEYLREAIASVLGQTHENFELLVIDNCSPDHTPEVVASFSDPRITYLRHQCNIGVLANWTYGTFLAKGMYISILGDDDKYKPDFLKKRIQAFHNAEKLVAVYGPYECWNDSDGSMTISNAIKMTNVSSGIQILSGIDCFKSTLWFQFCGASLYLTSAFQGKWESALRGGRSCDALVCALLALDQNCRMAWIPEADYIYRIHQQQACISEWDIVAQHGETMYRVLYEEAADQTYKSSDQIYKHMVRKKLIQFINFLGRVAWDKGNSDLARHYFKKELKVYPYSILTWLRLLRCLIRPMIKSGI